MTRGARLARTLWHPHQRLWNRRLAHILRAAGRAVGLSEFLVRALIWLDSILLLVTVVARRTIRYGPLAAWRLSSGGHDVLYVDCGVHTRGEQIRFMHEWFGRRWPLRIVGIEASGAHCEAARAHLSDIPRLVVRHAALVGPGHGGETATLFLHSASGRDATLLVPSAHAETVPAVHLSSILMTELMPPHEDALVVIRMNIEGSEDDVIADLVSRGMHARVAGWFGMWDDLAKRDPERARAFRRRLRDAGIRTFTFNGRDMRHRIRRLAIRLAIDAALRAAADRKKKTATEVAVQKS